MPVSQLQWLALAAAICQHDADLSMHLPGETCVQLEEANNIPSKHHACPVCEQAMPVIQEGAEG